MSETAQPETNTETRRAVANKHLSPITVLIGIIRNLPQFIIFIPAIAWGGGRFPIGTALLIGLGALTLSGFIVYLRWNSFRYGYDDDELVIESGLIATNRRAIPFDRIHDVNIERQLLHRIMGLAKVTVETGAKSGDEGDLNAVRLSEAESIRDAVRRYRADHKTLDQTTKVDVAEDPVLYTMSPARIVLSGMFSFSLILIAIIGGILNQVDKALNIRRAIEIFESRVSSVGAYIATHLVMAVLTLLALVLSIGVISGIIRSVLTDWGFTLTRTETGVRRVRGLFTRTDTVIPVKRVQAGLIYSGPVRRTLGWLRLAVQSVGRAGGEEDRRSGGEQVLMPLANPKEAESLLYEIQLAEPPSPDAMQPTGHAYFLRRLVWLIIVMVPVSIAVAIGAPHLAWAAIAGFLITTPLLWVISRHHRFLMNSDWLFIQNGWWSRRTVILPLTKVQTVSMDVGPIQRRLGAATLQIGVAGARRAVAIVDLPKDSARHLLAPLAAKARGTPL